MTRSLTTESRSGVVDCTSGLGRATSTVPNKRLHGLIELPATDTQQAQADRGLALVEGFVPGQKVTRP